MAWLHFACFSINHSKAKDTVARHGKTGQTRLTRNPIDPTRTRPDPPVLPCLPMLSRLILRYNFYKIFTYSSLLNMLCTPL